MIDKIKQELKSAMKSGDTRKRTILRLVVGEVDSVANADPKKSRQADESQVVKIIQKNIQANEELLKITTDPHEREDLEYQISILNDLLPQEFTEEEIIRVINNYRDMIIAAKSIGQAIGIVMKVIKQLSNNFNSVLVNEKVTEVYNEAKNDSN